MLLFNENQLQQKIMEVALVICVTESLIVDKFQPADLHAPCRLSIFEVRSYHFSYVTIAFCLIIHTYPQTLQPNVRLNYTL